MARVRLANWFRGQAPGSVVDVAADEVQGLRRDGRVAEVLDDEPAPATDASDSTVLTVDPRLEEGPPVAESPKSRRRKGDG